MKTNSNTNWALIGSVVGTVHEAFQGPVERGLKDDLEGGLDGAVWAASDGNVDSAVRRVVGQGSFRLGSFQFSWGPFEGDK